ncbi:MAG: MmgE/PrpD family protein, partial [Hyphomicrobiaceae bacterium]
FGVFGAAAAAAKSLELGRSETAMAIALSGVQAAGLKAAFGSDAKPYLAGRTAAAGVEAAMLAACGISGPPAVLEDSRGFLALFNDGVRDDQGVMQLGKVWRLADPGIFFKQFPVCSGAHAAVETAIGLLRTNRIARADVERVICEVPPVVAISLVYDRPATPQQAQFSMPYGIAAILVHGDLTVSSISESALRDPRMAEAMAKVEMRRVDSLHDDAAPEGARVTIRTRDGRELSAYLGKPSGMPGNPLSDADLRRKFLRCAAIGGVDGAAASRLLERLGVIETCTSLADVFSVSQHDARAAQSPARRGF